MSIRRWKKIALIRKEVVFEVAFSLVYACRSDTCVYKKDIALLVISVGWFARSADCWQRCRILPQDSSHVYQLSWRRLPDAAWTRGSSCNLPTCILLHGCSCQNFSLKSSRQKCGFLVIKNHTLTGGFGHFL